MTNGRANRRQLRGPAGVFKSAVKALHSAVCLGMIGGGLHMGDVEKGAECRPQGGCKLGSSVASDGGWDAEPLDPPVEKPRCAVGGGHGSEWNGFGPACCSVQDSEEKGVSC
jgi:hypothetical protein